MMVYICDSCLEYAKAQCLTEEGCFHHYTTVTVELKLDFKVKTEHGQTNISKITVLVSCVAYFWFVLVNMFNCLASLFFPCTAI